MPHDAGGDRQGLLRGVIDFFVSEPTTGEGRKRPDVSRHSAVWIRLPYLAVFRDLVFNALLALIRFTYRLVNVAIRLRKPYQGLIASIQARLAIPGKAILIVPDNSPPI